VGIQERKDREKEQRREEILNAAQAIFFAKGLQTTTMDEIAERAELSKGTLYLYFRSKEDLYLAVLLRGTEIMYHMFLDMAQKPIPILHRLKGLAEAYFHFYRSYPDYFRMLDFFETPHFHKQVSEEMHQQCSRANQRMWDLAGSLIREGQEQGMIHPQIAAAEAAVMVWACANGVIRQIDRSDEYWRAHLGVDLEKALFISISLLLEALMTEQAKQQHPDFIIYS
jgi:TetR/AcrR family transcriptional regulator